MNPSVLLQKLIDIEKSIGVEMESTTRHKVLEAQAYVLNMQWNAEDHVHRRDPDVGPAVRRAPVHRMPKPN